MPERPRYFTMGNALVVPLVKAMGKRISALAEDEQRS
jgi:DNA (cytosine-5)-methyltransferase 1